MSSADPIVQLSASAALRGFTAQSRDSDKTVYSFRGVPFAAPPVGELRFKKTAPLTLWDGEREAKTFGPQCPQAELPPGIFPFDCGKATGFSEDCLFLNIQTPSLDGAKRLPVMVNIHGGGYSAGAGDMFDGTQLCTFHDVVCVSINYRVHSLGFLCSYEDGVVPGNMGLYDQIEALKWVQKYITKFGGDPNNVTIYGESAGAISVSLLMLTKLSEGLYHKAISESGCCFTPSYILTVHEHRRQHNKFLEALGFTGTSTSELLTFLETVSGTDINAKGATMIWRPVQDGVMFDKSLHELYKHGQVRRVPWMVGANAHEGLLMMMFAEMMSKKKATDRDGAKANVRVFMKRNNHSEEWIDSMIDEVIDVYMKNKDPTDEGSYFRATTEIIGDFIFDYPHAVALEYHKQYSDCYQYHFNHRPKFAEKTKYPSWAVADHAWEFNFVFGFPFAKEPNATYNKDDEDVSKMMIDWWCNFAKTGVPSAENTTWPKYNDKGEYLDIKVNPTVETGYKAERMAAWERWYLKDFHVKQ